jgi:hypothetical protein
MKRTSVISSNVAEVGYDPSTQTLEVQFKDGSIYQYFDVPQHVYEGLMSAASKGQYLNKEIKFNYRYAKL